MTKKKVKKSTAVYEERKKHTITEQDLKDDFKLFLAYVWKFLMLPIPTQVQFEIAEYMQNPPSNRALVEAFRGIGKSWIAATFVVWLLWRDPQLKIMVVSASKLRADSFSIFCKRLIMEIPFLSHLRPRSDQRQSNVAFDVGPARAAQSPSVKSVGITGQLTGSRADYIIPDDVEVPNNSLTVEMREKLLQAWTEFESILKPNGNILGLGTPQSYESIYNKILSLDYSLRVWCAEVPTPDEYEIMGTHLAASIVKRYENEEYGEPVEPTRFGADELMARKMRMGKSNFALQMMLNTTLSDANRFPLKLSDLMIMSVSKDKAPGSLAWGNTKSATIEEIPSIGFAGDRFYRPQWIDEEWVPYEQKILVIDPSGRGADETAWCVLYLLHGNIFCPVFGGLQGGYEDDTLNKLAEVAKEHSVHEVVIEDNFGDGMFSKLLDAVLGVVYPTTIIDVKNHKQKELRIIDTLEPVMNQHRLIIDYNCIQRDVERAVDPSTKGSENFSLCFQLTRLSKDKGCLVHEDLADVLAIGCSHFSESMDVDAKKSVQRHKDKAFTEEVESWDKGFSLFPDKVVRSKERVNFHAKIFE